MGASGRLRARMEIKSMPEIIKGMSECFQLTRTDTEKLHVIFAKKSSRLDVSSFHSRGFPEQDWIDYLRTLPVEHIRRLSDHTNTVDHLLEAMNENPGRVVIRDPAVRDNFIIVEKSFAQTVLVMGDLP